MRRQATWWLAAVGMLGLAMPAYGADAAPAGEFSPASSLIQFRNVYVKSL